MRGVFVAVGSNIEPEKNLPLGLNLLIRAVSVVRMSTFFRTLPVGPGGQPEFVNGVLELETDLPPERLKHGLLRDIERQLGRVRTKDRYAPRPIDLDLILYGDRVISKPDLVVPDPEIVQRPFLALALLELESGLVLPGMDVPLRRLTDRLERRGMEAHHDLTQTLKALLRADPPDGGPSITGM